jgi:hypothetical protein
MGRKQTSAYTYCAVVVRMTSIGIDTSSAGMLLIVATPVMAAVYISSMILEGKLHDANYTDTAMKAYYHLISRHFEA